LRSSRRSDRLDDRLAHDRPFLKRIAGSRGKPETEIAQERSPQSVA